MLGATCYALVVHMTLKQMSKQPYEFSLILSGVDLTPDKENALFESGCDDATIAVRFGRVFLTFDRLAVSFKEAILKAIRDVKKAGVEARGSSHRCWQFGESSRYRSEDW